MEIDVASDLHIDKWVAWDQRSNQKQRLELFLKQILPDNPSSTLVMAGDLGHYNEQNLQFLQVAKQIYEHILLVFGNHDYYLMNSEMKEKYHFNSLERAQEMKKKAEKINGVVYLDGTTCTLNGVTFGGCGMWYDFSHGVKRFHKSYRQLYREWEETMKDADFLYGEPTRILQFYRKERKKLESVLEKSQVIITHVGPDSSKMLLKYELQSTSGCYYFDGSDLLNKTKNKIWIFGHTHVRYDFVKKGCWLVNAAFGNPGKESAGRKIVQIEV